jgi:hypothetical protein
MAPASGPSRSNTRPRRLGDAPTAASNQLRDSLPASTQSPVPRSADTAFKTDPRLPWRKTWRPPPAWPHRGNNLSPAPGLETTRCRSSVMVPSNRIARIHPVPLLYQDEPLADQQASQFLRQISPGSSRRGHQPTGAKIQPPVDWASQDRRVWRLKAFFVPDLHLPAFLFQTIREIQFKRHFRLRAQYVLFVSLVSIGHFVFPACLTSVLSIEGDRNRGNPFPRPGGRWRAAPDEGCRGGRYAGQASPTSTRLHKQPALSLERAGHGRATERSLRATGSWPGRGGPM